MAVITSGATPLSLPGGMNSVTTQADPREPLVSSALGKLNEKPKKPPKIKKRAFGQKQPGAAFRK